jgi:SAM-dependent methyltransferase
VTARGPRLYDELAPWFHLLTAPQEYAEEAALYRRLLTEASERPIRTVLELGSGGGNNASHLKAHFELTLVDRSPQMLELSRSLNPDCRHVVGDMRDVRLGETFDGVFVHDAVAYITNLDDLRLVAGTAFAHCRPGGAALFVPDWVRETFEPGTEWGGHDGTDRAIRYLEWRWDPAPDDRTYLMDFAYLFREADGSLHAESDRHECGLFSEASWLDLLRSVGFEADAIDVHLGEPVGSRALLARRPRGGAGSRRGGQ